MKNKYRLVVLLPLVLLASCKDYLEENNRSALTSDFYKTTAGLEALVNSCYTATRNIYYREVPIQMLESGTDLFAKGNDNKQAGFAGYDVNLNGANAGVREMWTLCYKAVEWANTALANLDGTDMDAARKERLRGEVSFLRALFNWHIVETWGKTILRTAPADTADPEFTAPVKSTEAQFYKRILDDLELAGNALKGIDPKDGRVSEWAVKAMKARVLLYLASEYNQEAIGAEQAEENALAAAETAVDVIEHSGRRLAEDFRQLWSMDNSDGGKNEESVWFVNYTQDLDLTARWDGDGGNQAFCVYTVKYDDQPGLTRSILYGRPFNRVMVTLRALNLFDRERDQRYRGSFRDVWLVNDRKKLEAAQSGSWPKMKAVGDTAIWILPGIATPRQRAWAEGRYQLLDNLDIYKTDDEEHVPDIYDLKKGIQLNKFQDSTRGALNEARSARDAIVFRISELYLIASEGYWRAGDPVNAVKYMNLLREKRAVPGYAEAMKITASDLSLDFYLDENAREFMGEMHRWYDLKRTKKLVEYVNKYNPNVKDDNRDGNGRGRVQEYHYVRPIPQTQLDAITNPEAFRQNPGYN